MSKIEQVLLESVDSKRGADWKFSLMAGLAVPGVPRIMTASEFHQIASKYRPEISLSTARTASHLLVSAGALQRVSNGMFLNKRSNPPTEIMELASHIRDGAMISLHSTLGECGFLNNPSDIVTAVLPTSAEKRPRLGEVLTSGGNRFRFYGLAEKFFPATDMDRFQMLQQGRACAVFRPEASVLHWLHLANMNRSQLTMLPVDVDVDILDMDLLTTLAEKWKLEKQLASWFELAKKSDFGSEPEEVVVNARSAPTEEKMQESQSAKERLLARKLKN